MGGLENNKIAKKIKGNQFAVRLCTCISVFTFTQSVNTLGVSSNFVQNVLSVSRKVQCMCSQQQWGVDYR